jgi:hypothetical protein
MAKGQKTGGRAKGTPNKITRDIREAVLQSFETAGGAEYLATQARDNPTAYLTLLGKVLPMQVTGEVVTRIVRDKPLSAAEWAARHAADE